MKGRYFIEVLDSKLITQGLVVQEVGHGQWLCQFVGAQPVERVVPAERMGAMILFRSKDLMDQWIKANSQPAEEPEGVPAEVVAELQARVEGMKDWRLPPKEVTLGKRTTEALNEQIARDAEERALGEQWRKACFEGFELTGIDPGGEPSEAVIVDTPDR